MPLRPTRDEVTGASEIRLNRVAKAIVRRALREDLGSRGDITTRATIPTDKEGEAIIVAKQRGIIAGQRIAEWVFHSLERSICYDILAADGTEVDPTCTVAHISGRLWAILVGERTALNLMGRAAGIATLTAEYVRRIAGTGAKISETRKTAPGLRYLDKAAVRTGGGVNHRYALYDAFLIKENHISAAGGITPAIQACRDFAARRGRFRIMVEVRSWEEYLEALRAQPDRILLDNLPPDDIRSCVQAKVGDVELEASGGITLDNVRQYAETGVDFISVGALTHSVKAMDLSLLVKGTSSLLGLSGINP